MAQNKTMTDYFMHDLSITQQKIRKKTQKPTNKMNTLIITHNKKIARK